MEPYCFILDRVVWTSTYTYILLLFVAAAFVAFVARPRGHVEVVKRLYAGELIEEGGEPVAEKSGPYLRVACGEGGKVVIERVNVEGLTESGAVSLAVTFKGKDVEILERVNPGYDSDRAVAGARFTIDMAGFEWRQVKWSDEESGLWCAFSLHIRQGIEFTVPLKR